MASTTIDFIPNFDDLDRDIEDEEFQTTVDVQGDAGPGGGGGLSPSEQQQQEDAIAGGLTQGLAAAGIFGALLSQLKSITGIVSAVFGAISRALVPIVEKLADFIRPFVQDVNKALQGVPEAQEDVKDAAQGVLTGGPIAGQVLQNLRKGKGLTALRPGIPFGVGARTLGPKPTGEDPGFRSGPLGTTVKQGTVGEDILEAIGVLQPSQSADQTGEATKQQFKQNLDDVQREKAGNLK